MSDETIQRVDWRISMERARTTMFGCASACAAVLFLALQGEELRSVSGLPVFFAAIGIPLSIAAAFMAECYADSTFPKLPRSRTADILALAFVVSGAAAMGSVWSLLHLHFPIQANIFGFLCVLFLIGTIAFSVLVKHEEMAQQPK